MRQSAAFASLCRYLMFTASLLYVGCAAARQPQPGHLEIHYIALGQGGGTLIIGPDGTMILYDFGRVAGRRHLVPYLRDVIGLQAGDHIHYAMVSHGDTDHYVGYRDMIEIGGIDVLRANYEPGTPKVRTATMRRYWLDPAMKTRGKAFQPVPVGLRIALGAGAEAHVVAANGVVLNDPLRPRIANENDRSIALFVRHGRFTYLLDGDLGGGPDPCTGHVTGQVDVQRRVASALRANDLLPPDVGLDVMHVAHHGSESSTPAGYFNALAPRLALVSVGPDQGDFRHPRVSVVERVLLDVSRPGCVLAPPVLAVLQTGAGSKRPCSGGNCTSFAGAAVGHIVVRTDGRKDYSVSVQRAPDARAARFVRLAGPPPWRIPVAAEKRQASRHK